MPTETILIASGDDGEPVRFFVVRAGKRRKRNGLGWLTKPSE